MIELKLREAVVAAELPVTSELIQKLDNYLQLLMKWSRSINLVGTREADAICDRHIADCLQVCRVLPRDPQRIVDVGSGAGLPGLVIAMARPDCDVICLEPVHKKRSFITAARREVELDNVEAHAERLEDYLARERTRPVDVAVSRATWAVPIWLERGRELIHENGVVIAMEGAERHPLMAGATRVTYQLADRERALVVYSPSGDSSSPNTSR